MDRLNSGTKNRHNFFIQANFKYLNVGSYSVNHDESGDINFDMCEKFVPSCPLTKTPTQKLKSGFSTFGSQGIALSLL